MFDFCGMRLLMVLKTMGSASGKEKKSVYGQM